MYCWLPPLALLLDLLLADPRGIPHPVQGIAWLADKLENPARRMPFPVLAGGMVLCSLLFITGSLALILLRLPSLAGIIATLYLSWSGLALGGLLREGQTALALLDRAQSLSLPGSEQHYAEALARARNAVGMLVSRDTASMNPPELYRSLAESISENLNDAFTAPFFWLCAGGPIALWLYKTASTMDSMWGYKNERWRYLGKASARLDDLLAFLPARISVLLMLVAAWLEATPRKRLFAFSPPPQPGSYDSENRGTRSPGPAGGSLPSVPGWPGWAVVAKQAGQCDSPNAGWPMAAAAWLFNGRSGGPTPYDGKLVDKPLLGSPCGQWTPENIRALLRHVRLAGLLGGLAGSAVVWMLF